MERRDLSRIQNSISCLSGHQEDYRGKVHDLLDQCSMAQNPSLDLLDCKQK